MLPPPPRITLVTEKCALGIADMEGNKCHTQWSVWETRRNTEFYKGSL